MLGKLMKYELKAMGRKLLPLYGAVLVLSLIAGVPFNAEGKHSFKATVLLFLLLAVVMVMTVVLVIQRFSRNLLGREGYLVLTLPVSSASHILNKVFSAVIWMALSAAVAFFAMFLLMALTPMHGTLFDGWGFLTGSFYAGGVPVTGDIVGLTAEVVIMILLAFAVFALMIYASISIGHQADSHQGLLSVVAFVVICMIENGINSLLRVSVPSSLVLGSSSIEIDGAMMNQQQMLHAIEKGMGIGILFLAVWCVIFYFITWYLLDCRLNLE